jgi:hypothetical protein
MSIDIPGRGKAGEAVPPVEPDDLKAVCRIAREHHESGRGRHVVLGQGVFEAVCSKGANAGAVTYRAMFLGLLPFLVSDARKDKPDEALYQVMAKIPMEWIGCEERQHPPFNLEELSKRLSEARSV